MSNLEFEGPDRQYHPPLGDAESFDNEILSNPDLIGEYANLTILNNLLDQLSIATTSFIVDLEDDLQNLSLVVTDTNTDTKLRDALAVEWPPSLGPVKNVITYRYYVYLENRDSAAAHYIRQRYEDAARDVTGTSALDLVILMKLVRNEIGLVREFLDVHVGTLNDSSERRVVELLQDWASAAVEYTGKFRDVYAKRDEERQFPDSEVAQVGPDDALNAQALFKVTLNQVNNNLTNTIKLLQKNFQNFSDVFYHNFLGPSISFRNNVTKNIYPVMTGQLGLEVVNATNAMNGQFALVLADLARRIKFFNDKFDELIIIISTRDNYRSYIKQLSDQGKSTDPGTPGTLISQTDSSDETDFFASIQEAVQTVVSSNQFTAPHGNLSDTANPDAHPQYLTSAGGQISGPITLSNAASIDGSVPSIHAHQGPDIDGTQQISGQSLLPGSLTSNLVSTADKPTIPTNLRIDTIVKHSDSSVLGSVTYDITFIWEGDVGSRYEVQISQLPNN